jgi:hypothetical protein
MNTTIRNNTVVVGLVRAAGNLMLVSFAATPLAR